MKKIKFENFKKNVLSHSNNNCLLFDGITGSNTTFINKQALNSKHLVLSEKYNIDLTTTKLTTKNTCGNSNCFNIKHINYNEIEKSILCVKVCKNTGCNNDTFTIGLCSSCYGKYRREWVENHKPSKREFLNYKKTFCKSQCVICQELLVLICVYPTRYPLF